VVSIDGGHSFVELFAAAERALAQAKSDGRNRVRGSAHKGAAVAELLGDAPDPAAILERVNRVLQVQSATVATALVATIDRNLESMRYASAGHPPPIVAGPSGAAQSLPYGSIPLGVLIGWRSR